MMILKKILKIQIMIMHPVMKCHGNRMIWNLMKQKKASMYLSDTKFNFKITITRNDEISKDTQHNYDSQILAKMCC